jgi:uncharacterized membrane protein
MTVYEWMFHSPYFIMFVVIGVAVFIAVAIQEHNDRKDNK